MKGSLYYTLLSLLGIAVAIYMVFLGVNGQTINPFILLLIGIFFAIKEVLDIITGG
jgi:hypothetical protein